MRRIAFRALLCLCLAGCLAAENKPELRDWTQFTSRARPAVLRDPREPDEDLEAFRKAQEDRERAEEARLASQPKVTSAFVDLAIRDAFFEISNQVKIPIVLDPSVSGSVTLNLKDAPLESALRMVSFSGGYTFSKDAGVYYVGTPDPQSKAYLTLSSSRIVSTYNPPKLIIAGLNKSYASFLSYSEGTNKIVLTGPTAVLDRLEAEIHLLDRPPAQIQIEALVVETKLGSDLGAGLDYGKLEAAFQKELHTDNDPSTKNLQKIDLIGKLALTYEMMAGENLAVVHAHPKLVTTSGTAAEIKSLVESYVVINRPGATFVTSELQIIKSGTTLKVTPMVTRNNEIELTVEPELADVVGISPESSGSLPVISRRSVRSTIRLKSGEVLIIGGSYEDSVRNAKTGLPFLKDLPVVSLVTGKVSDQTRTSELMIFVSPKVLK